MSLNTLVDYISNSQITSELIKRISKKNELNIVGSSRYAKSIILDSIAKKEKKNILLICPNVEIAYKWIGYFESINDKKVLYYPPTEHLPYASINKSKEIEFSQLTVLSKLIKKERKELNIVISTERSLQPHLLNKNLFIENKLDLQKGVRIEIQELAKKLTLLGYTKENVTSTEGFWSRRGEIIDIYPVNNEFPVRLEFFDNVVDKIREYDPHSQKTLESINNIEIIQAGLDLLIKDKLNNLSKNSIFNSEDIKKNNLDRYLGIIEKEPSNIIDFINRETILVIDELEDCKKFANNWYLDSESNFDNCSYEINENLKNNDINLEAKPNLHLKLDEILNSLENFNLIKLYEFESKDNIENRFLLNDKRLNSYSKNIGKLSNDINKNIKNKEKVWILSAQPLRTKTLLFEHECNTNFLKNPDDIDEAFKSINNSTPLIIKNKNNYEIEGFYLPMWKVVLITDKELFSQQYLFNNVFIRRKKISVNSNINVNKITPGDFIVHKNHGIGKFLKIEKINITGDARDYLVIQYQDGKISVAADQLSSVNRYRSSGKIKPKINKLGGTEWERIKDRNKKQIKKVAVDILKLYAKREKLKGHIYPEDGPWQDELEESFPYQPTPDQITAVKEIKSDMESDKPMDRLVCGDVGFGKTEVAVRAIFKAITSGKQVILLAPTTILAQQHWRTINNRFSPYPIKVSLLNRFKTPNERKEIYAGLKNNKIDLVVATHQILGKEIEIKNLGLLVIDEEQRFGVRQKEKIKKIKTNIDVLTLSATPIPRTLYMSLSGLRQMSLLNTPPPSRRSIKTYLSEIDMDVIRTAINQELDRGGQIFYVLPRISDIDQAVNKLKNMFPSLKFIVAHGQMNETELENAMIAFNNGEVDLMICTTIIESGLDIPKVNTIIIEDSHKFGLSQLYQLRGRVGRSGVQAHAWLFYPNINKINNAAKQRLKAIKDFSELGSGYELAMKDMEIRGVGSLLGEEQSGKVNAIGYDLYIEMLHEAISEISGQEIPEVSDTQIDLPINAFIPATWILNRVEKLEAYKSATECSNNNELTELATDWVNRYGTLPQPVESLIMIMRLKLLAKKCGFSKIKLKKPNILIETKLKNSTFKILKNSLASSVQNKFNFDEGEQLSVITIRGLGVTEIQNQIDQLILWFGSFEREIKNFDKELLIKRE
ncbi:transcription-repair coupling factor [Prochlorococcus marinus str. MU1402]|uniref:transcription-repair coupling factor n=1 Tax=Prochlorococcus marinus TaxID=1219 RepID=UPI001AD9D010|nr:transcription-repair coupling factor [Prochlorococcus marinus]MBO8232031.1 transcription-repair coupling factor [Prochlorococcus marinus XMU1402]MBW3056770.1 transcription-repair coupling factor [Prochlorococcus marinus str. MU1402]